VVVVSAVVLYTIAAAAVLRPAGEDPRRALFLPDVSGHNAHFLRQKELCYNHLRADLFQSHVVHCDKGNWFATAAAAVLEVSMRLHH